MLTDRAKSTFYECINIAKQFHLMRIPAIFETEIITDSNCRIPKSNEILSADIKAGKKRTICACTTELVELGRKHVAFLKPIRRDRYAPTSYSRIRLLPTPCYSSSMDLKIHSSHPSFMF